jgi:hypothetical protein
VDRTLVANRDIISVASELETAFEENHYQIPALQRWSVIANINAIMLVAFCILFVFMLHQRDYNVLIYRFSDLIGPAFISLAAAVVSLALDYAATRLYQTAGRRVHTQCGQILDYTSLVSILVSLAILGWTGFCFVRVLIFAAPYIWAMLA